MQTTFDEFQQISRIVMKLHELSSQANVSRKSADTSHISTVADI